MPGPAHAAPIAGHAPGCVRSAGVFAYSHPDAVAITALACTPSSTGVRGGGHRPFDGKRFHSEPMGLVGDTAAR